MNSLNSYMKRQRTAVFICAAALIALIGSNFIPAFRVFEESPSYYVSIHMVMEMFSIATAVMIACVAWNAHSKSEHPLAKVVIFGFSAVAGIDMLHVVYFGGMPGLFIEPSTNTSIYFWLWGRLIECVSLALLVASIELRGGKLEWLIASVLLVVSLYLLAALIPDAIPVFYIPGSGLTRLKIGIEYLNFAANLILCAWYYRKSLATRDASDQWLAVACFLVGTGSLALTQYMHPDELMNLIGHLYKIAAYYFIYKAIFQVAVHKPYELLGQSEKEKSSKAEELNNILENMPVSVVRLDSKMSVTYANSNMLDAFEVRNTFFLGRYILDLVAQDLRGQLLPILTATISGMRIETEIKYTCKNGRSRSAYCISLPETDLRSESDGALVIFSDTTEREEVSRKLIETLRESSQIKTALDAHAIVAITDARGIIMSVNDKFCDISKYSREELLGRSHHIINSGHHPKGFFKEMWETIAMANVWSGEICNRAKDGRLYWVQSTIMPLLGPDGGVHNYIAIRADITSRKEAEAEAHHLAMHDALTGLPNRRLMMDRLRQSISSSNRRKRYVALMLLDLDFFKEINDTLGHSVGDLLLLEVTKRLKQCVRDSDTVARLGGDEFVTIIDDIGDSEAEATQHVASIGEKIKSDLSASFNLAGKAIDISVSIGVVIIFNHDASLDNLIMQADMALYKAKDAGRNQLCFFDEALQAETLQRAQLQRDLRQALSNADQFRLYYQPVVDASRAVIGYEALIRWEHPELGLISPALFIPIAEQSGLILGLGDWILEQACSLLKQWSQDTARQHLTIAVNISAKQLSQIDFVARVMGILRESGAPASRLRLEITESMLQHDLDVTVAKMNALRAQGVRFSLDDFGTGYSSMSYLKKMPLDQLKIDKSFVDEIMTDKTDSAIAHTVITLAKYLELDVVAEGVEQDEQFKMLSSMGCKAFQGYFFGKPAPAPLMPPVQSDQASVRLHQSALPWLG